MHQGAHEYRLAGIRDTWGWKCDKLFAASDLTSVANISITKNDHNDTHQSSNGNENHNHNHIGFDDKIDIVNFGAIDLPHFGKEEYNNMWQKTRSIFGYVHDNYISDYDYF